MKGSCGVEITDLTDRIGKIDLQGPMAGKIMKKVLLKPDDVLKYMPYFTFKGHYQSLTSPADTVQLTNRTPILLSRTGYTGEFGFEIFIDPLHLATVCSADQSVVLDTDENAIGSVLTCVSDMGIGLYGNCKPILRNCLHPNPTWLLPRLPEDWPEPYQISPFGSDIVNSGLGDAVRPNLIDSIIYFRNENMEILNIGM